MTTLHLTRAIDSVAGSYHDLFSQGPASKDASADCGDAAELDREGLAYLRGLIAFERRRHGRPVADVVGGDDVQFREAVDAQLRFTARETVIRHLGLETGNDPEFDAGVLLASLAVLQRFSGRSARRLIRRGLEVIADRQDMDGSWRADLIPDDSGRVIYVSGLEMAVILANMLLADLNHGNLELVPVLAPTLTRCFRSLEAGFLESQGSSSSVTARQPLWRGWGNDRVRKAGNVESWTTALALQFLLRLHAIGRLVQQANVLSEFGHVSGRQSAARWPDMARFLPESFLTSSELEERVGKSLEGVSDPTPGRALVSVLTEEIVRPIVLGPFKRPDRIASFLLYGPPGARKTSLVRALSHALGWPLLTVSPPDFLINGIEGFERRAAEIFSGLMCLEDVVILFDECEEFFRRRLRIRSPESRTHGAFMTAGMLPRLQELRDLKRCVFALATNLELDELDPAVVRRGRLDYRLYVGHPERAAQVEYLRNRLGEHQHDVDPDIISQALERYERDHLADRNVVLNGRQTVAEERRKRGDFEGYWEEMDQIRAARNDLPLITFQLLDRAAAGEFVTTRPSVDELFQALVSSAVEF